MNDEKIVKTNIPKIYFNNNNNEISKHKSERGWGITYKILRNNVKSKCKSKGACRHVCFPVFSKFILVILGSAEANPFLQSHPIWWTQPALSSLLIVMIIITSHCPFIFLSITIVSSAFCRIRKADGLFGFA